MTTAHFTLFDTPIGTCSLVWKDDKIVGLRLPEASPAATRARIAAALGSTPRNRRRRRRCRR